MIFGRVRCRINGTNKDQSYLGGVPIEWPIGESLRVSTYSYAGEIQAAFYGFDTSHFLKVRYRNYTEMEMLTSKRKFETIIQSLLNMYIQLTR